MNSIFKHLFPFDKSADRQGYGKARQESTDFPVSLRDHQKRALTEWIADRMRRNLGIARERHSLADEIDCFSLAASMVDWESRKEDVYLNLKNMRPPDSLYRCFLETYEDVKADMRLYLPSWTEREEPRDAEENVVWQVYRDVIYAVTQRKFLLIRQDEIESYKLGVHLCMARIRERSDIPKAREAAKKVFIDIGMPQTELMSHLLVVSEAITNVLKHAKSGTMSIVLAGSKIHVLVEDEGPGFSLKLLPSTALTAGYSTKKSLGQGFTLMMKMTERILLSFVPDQGSTLILIFERKESASPHEQAFE